MVGKKITGKKSAPIAQTLAENQNRCYGMNIFSYWYEAFSTFSLGGSSMVFKMMLVAAIAVCALVFSTGCQQKAPAGKKGETVEQRAESSQKIISESIKRVHDSMVEVKKEAQAEKKAQADKKAQ
jgi:hypothetical protein